MSVQTTIEHKLGEALEASHLEVTNESHRHNVPPGSESHFKVVVVADAFAGKSLVARHQLVYDALKAELAGPIHALALHTFTEEDWRRQSASSLESPPCRGGEKRTEEPGR